MSPLISPSTWISPLEVTLPVIVRSSPIIDGTILPALGRGLLEAKVAGTGAFASPTTSTNLVTPQPCCDDPWNTLTDAFLPRHRGGYLTQRPSRLQRIYTKRVRYRLVLGVW